MMDATHNRHTYATVSILMIVLMVIPAPMQLLALDLPDEFREEREAIHRAITAVERQSQPSDSRRQATRSGEVLWQVEGERTWRSSRSGRASIPTDFGRLAYGFDEGQAYRVETVTGFQAFLPEPRQPQVRLLDEPRYQAPEALTGAVVVPGLREVPTEADNARFRRRFYLGTYLAFHIPIASSLYASFSDSEHALFFSVFLGSAPAIGLLGLFWAFGGGVLDRIVASREKKTIEQNENLIATEYQDRIDEARAAHETELMRVRTENQRRREEAREAYDSELHRVRAENERREASNRHAAVAVHNLDTGTIDMVWRGDPRFSGRAWPPDVE